MATNVNGMTHRPCLLVFFFSPFLDQDNSSSLPFWIRIITRLCSDVYFLVMIAAICRSSKQLELTIYLSLAMLIKERKLLLVLSTQNSVKNDAFETVFNEEMVGIFHWSLYRRFYAAIWCHMGGYFIITTSNYFIFL